MRITIVTTISGQFVKAFLNEETARKWILKQPGKFNNYDAMEVEVEE